MQKARGEVRYERLGPVGYATISRPGKKNSMTLDMLGQLKGVVAQAGQDRTLRVLVIRGDGPEAFAAGVDLSVLEGLSAQLARSFSISAQEILTGIEALPVPVIAAVRGFAMGGGLELALACDLILASDSARLALPETNLGILPGWGGCIRLPRRVGLGRAKEMIFSGRVVGASEALAMGLADTVYADDAFEGSVAQYAAMLAAKSPASLALAKSTVLRGMDASLEAGLALEREAFAYCFSLPDAREGITAFLEKRKPRFRSEP